MNQSISTALSEALEAGRKYCSMYAAIARDLDNGHEFIDGETVTTSPGESRSAYREALGYQLARVINVVVIEMEPEGDEAHVLSDSGDPVDVPRSPILGQVTR